MLTKINRLKGLGLVFSDFSWDNATTAFKEVNLIYGWNGCGKTTLTRLFDHFGGQAQEIECELETDTGLVTHADALGRQVRVFMIGNSIVAGSRRANIVEMDKTLREHESEYHYLFKRLKELRQAQDGTIAAAYPVPNMARKLWETFLMYRVPNSQNFYRKMQVLKDDGLDPQKLDAIYKFTNDQSHITGAGFNPSLVPEAMNAMNAIFEMMEASAPEHYSILDATTQ